MKQTRRMPLSDLGRKIAGGALGIGLAFPLAAQAAPWTVRTGEIGGRRTLVVENERISADFLQEYAWMLARVFVERVPVISWTGANGAVVSLVPEAPWERPQETWIGSGHGGERIVSFAVEVDGMSHAYRDRMSFSGRVVRLVKVSEMGPFLFHHTVEFPASGDRIVQDHHFTAREGSQWFRHMYAIMHQVPKPFHDWIAWRFDGTPLTGSASLGDGSRAFQDNVRAVALYNEEQGLGVVLAYADDYPSRNGQGHFMNDRSHDNKLYFQPDLRSADLVPGRAFSFRATVIPFRSVRDTWAAEAERVLKNDRRE